MSLQSEAIELSRYIEQQTALIHAHKDANLSPEGLRAAKERGFTTARDEWRGKVTSLRSRIEAERQAARDRAAAARPRADDAASLIRGQQKWAQAQTLLESGRQLRQIVATADVDMVTAIAEFAPTYLQAQSRPRNGINDLEYSFNGEGLRFAPDGAPDITGIIDSRLIEILPATQANVLRQSRETLVDAAAALPYIELSQKHADGHAETANRIEAAISSQMDAAAAAA